MNRQLIYEISHEFNNYTIDTFLKAQGYSSANITAIKKMPNNVVIDGQWVHMNRKLVAGETLTVNIIEEASSERIPPVKIPLDIVYEDEDIIVINKPAGLSIHPSLNHYEDSLANGLAYYYEAQGKPFIFRCANRLDKNTSGLTVVAKHLVSGNILSTMVRNRHFYREYYAIVRGHLDEAEGTIDAPIGRMDNSIITRQVDFENGDNAITHYKVIEEKNYIIGLGYIMRNLFNGKEIAISHKAPEEFDDFKELKIKSNEYLKELNVRFPNNVPYLSQLGFTTTKNNKILVGEEEGELKEIIMNKGNNVIVGMFGNIGKHLTSIGCWYVSKSAFASSILYKFFLLRHLKNKDKNFKKKWDERYNELPKEFKFIWNTVNLPDNIYSLIMNCCI